MRCVEKGWGGWEGKLEKAWTYFLYICIKFSNNKLLKKGVERKAGKEILS